MAEDKLMHKAQFETAKAYTLGVADQWRCNLAGVELILLGFWPHLCFFFSFSTSFLETNLFFFGNLKTYCQFKEFTRYSF